MTKIEFQKKLFPIAEEILKKFSIHPIITVVQSAHESNWGNSKLTELANNLFGYTASEKWLLSGEPILHMSTTEYSTYPPEKLHYWNRAGDIIDKVPYHGGSKLTVSVPFRKYETWDKSVLDWATNIATQSRYMEAYKCAKEGNLELYAQAIQKAGYATDPNYAQQLSIIGKFVLSQEELC
jgi:flagellum-specific peptidoglycan hydrolase FlgJ